MRIAILYNKPSERFANDETYIAAETDTEESAVEVKEALTDKGADAALFPVTETSIPNVVASIRADLIFNLIEWTGVDTKYAMQTFDEMNRRNLRYTGATKENYHDTCDKIITKRLCKKFGLPTASWQEFETGNEEIDPSLTYPMIVKIASEHSSVGIEKDSVVRNSVELARVVTERVSRYQAPVFAETFLSGREFQVTLLEERDGVRVLPPAEIIYRKGTDVPLLTYNSRWDEKNREYLNSDVRVAKSDDQVVRNLFGICRNAYGLLGFRDYARFDIRCDANGTPYFLELNSNPGLGDDDEYGMTLSYKAAGMTFADFIWKIVTSAKRRYGI